MIYNLIQKTITATGKTRDEVITLLTNSQNELLSVLFPADVVRIAAVWEAKTYKKIDSIFAGYWRESISSIKSFYYENATLTLRTDQTSLITIAKSDVYNFDFAVWKKTKLFGINGNAFVVSLADLLGVTESGDNYIFECYSPDLEQNNDNQPFSGIFTPYKPVAGAAQLLYDMAIYNDTATDAERQALGIKTEKLKEYSYTKEKGDSEAFQLSYPEPILKRIAALRKQRIPYIV